MSQDSDHGSQLPPEEAARINARSEKLLQEFKEHLREVSSGLLDTHGWLVAIEGGIDENRVFQAWCVQKIAALQTVVLDLEAKLNMVVEDVYEDTGEDEGDDPDWP